MKVEIKHKIKLVCKDQPKWNKRYTQQKTTDNNNQKKNLIGLKSSRETVPKRRGMIHDRIQSKVSARYKKGKIKRRCITAFSFYIALISLSLSFDSFLLSSRAQKKKLKQKREEKQKYKTI